MRLSNTVLALLFIVLASAMLAMTTTFPPFPGQKYGPSLFPRILGVGIIVCCLLLMIRELRSGARPPSFRIDPVFSQPYKLVSFLLVPGAIVAYLLLAERLGFVPTCFGLLLGLMLWFGVKKLTALVVALLMTALLNWFFGTLMRVPLPRGLFMQLLQGG